MNIVIYSTTTCPYCKMLKTYLTSKNLKFEEKFVDQSEKARIEMSNVSRGFLGVPFMVLTKDDGTSQTIIGFDKGKLEQILA